MPIARRSLRSLRRGGVESDGSRRLVDVPLIVESAQVFDTHHVALLVAAGASASCHISPMSLRNP